MNKQQLASKIGESGNTMRSKIKANEFKWATPLVDSMAGLPAVILHSFIARQMADTEASLASLLEELTGNEFDRKGLHE